MKCNNCGVTVNSPSKYCPICSNKLKRSGTNTIYPKIKRNSFGKGGESQKNFQKAKKFKIIS